MELGQPASPSGLDEPAPRAQRGVLELQEPIAPRRWPGAPDSPCAWPREPEEPNAPRRWPEAPHTRCGWLEASDAPRRWPEEPDDALCGWQEEPCCWPEEPAVCDPAGGLSPAYSSVLGEQLRASPRSAALPSDPSPARPLPSEPEAGQEDGSRLRAVFDALDRDGDGFVRMEDFIQFATAYGAEQVGSELVRVE